MSAHDAAITAAARVIRTPRYRMYACTDEELAELVVRTYYQNLPVRTRPPRRRMQARAAEQQSA
jgi:hypothetical protein